MNRRCSKCKQELLLSEFGVRRQRKDGISLWCKSCCRMSIQKRRATDEGATDHRTRERERHRKNPEPARKRAKEWHHSNPDRAKQNAISGHTRRMRSPEYKKKEYARIAEWGKLNPARVASNRQSNRLLRRRAQPRWLTLIQKAQIREFYEISMAKTRQTGVKHHVDHVFAISGATFNGLHVPWNLQILTATQNDEKWIKVPQEFEHQLWNKQRHLRSGA